MKLVCAGMLATFLAFSQSDNQTGAKAIFEGAGKDDKEVVDTSSHSAATRIKPKVEATGLKISAQLREPDGTLRPVSLTRIFHTGEHIRLHVSTNVDGDLVIYQKQDAEPEQLLFPSTKIANATAHVSKNTDVVLPSGHGWFIFDEHPGEIVLTVMVTAGTAKPHIGEESDANSKVQIASAETANKTADAQAGSRALKIEDDPADDKAQYAVVNSGGGNVPAEEIARKVTLVHAK